MAVFFVFSANQIFSKMSDYFLYYQKCNKNRCNYYQFFKIPPTNYGDNGRCMPYKFHKRPYSFLYPSCKMISFLSFETVPNEAYIIYLKRQQFVINLRKQIKDERTPSEQKRKKQCSIRRIDF